MPRKARIDAPGALHHIICRGIEQRKIFELRPEDICKPGNQPLRVTARSLVCYWAVRELGMSGTKVGKLLGISQSAVSRAVVRGEKLTRDMNLSLLK